MIDAYFLVVSFFVTRVINLTLPKNNFGWRSEFLHCLLFGAVTMFLLTFLYPIDPLFYNAYPIFQNLVISHLITDSLLGKFIKGSEHLFNEIPLVIISIYI